MLQLLRRNVEYAELVGEGDRPQLLYMIDS
jgi:hypothetical protein